jgi:hypothetical protein
LRKAILASGASRREGGAGQRVVIYLSEVVHLVDTLVEALAELAAGADG